MVLAPVGAVAAYTHCGEDAVSPADAGADVADAGPRRDSGADARLPDAAPGWRIYTELPNCDLQVPIDVQATAPKPKWRACPGGNPVCDQIDPSDWTPPSPDERKSAWFANVRRAPKADYVSLEYRIEALNAFEQDVFALPTLDPVQSWLQMDDVSCSVRPYFAPAMGMVVQTLPTAVQRGKAYGAMPAVFTSPPYQVFAPSLPQGEFVGDVGMSDTTVAFDLRPSFSVVRLAAGETTYARTSKQTLLDPVVVGDVVFARHDHGTDGWTRVVRVDKDGSTVPFRAVPMHHINGFRADGGWVVWLERFGSANFQDIQPTVELWAAPFSSDPTVVAATAKKVATLPGAFAVPYPAYASGYYAITNEVDAPKVYVVRLSDGAVQIVDVDQAYGPGLQRAFELTRIVAVSATELWGVIGEVWGPAGRALARIRLGPWP